MGREILTDMLQSSREQDRGSGRATAGEFADEGCALALVDTSPQTISEVEGELGEKRSEGNKSAFAFILI